MTQSRDRTLKSLVWKTPVDPENAVILEVLWQNSYCPIWDPVVAATMAKITGNNDLTIECKSMLVNYLEELVEEYSDATEEDILKACSMCLDTMYLYTS